MKILGNDLKISLKELIFQRCLNKFLATRFEDFHRSCRNCYAPRNLNYLWSEPCTVSKVQGISKKYSENFVDYFSPSKNGMTESRSTRNLFHTIVMHNKPSIEKLVFVIKSPVY